MNIRSKEGDRHLLSKSEVGHEANVWLSVPMQHPLPVYLIFLLIIECIQVEQRWVEFREKQWMKQTCWGKDFPANTTSIQFKTSFTSQGWSRPAGEKTSLQTQHQSSLRRDSQAKDGADLLGKRLPCKHNINLV